MAGGAGTRLDRGEKPLFEIAGEPMVERVLEALEASVSTRPTPSRRHGRPGRPAVSKDGYRSSKRPVRGTSRT